MKIICPKCGIIHDEDFAPCKLTPLLPPVADSRRDNSEELVSQEHLAATLTEEAPRYQSRERVLAAAAGAGVVEMRAPGERAAAVVAVPERPADDGTSSTWPAATGEPEWRREVTERLESYRARRRKYRPLDVRGGPDDSQPLLALAADSREAPRIEAALVEETKGEDVYPDGNGNGNSNGNGHENENGHGLPVVEFAAAEPEVKEEEYVRRRAALRIAARPRRAERVEITVMQPQFDFSVNEAPALHPQNDERPVADLRERRLAGLVDATILGATCAGFFLLFRALGGEFSLSRFSVAACLASAYLVYAQYFVLFTVFMGLTPGMMLRGLELLTLDGNAPSTRHLLWRSFGYLISAGAVFLGFLWAWWDDDHLTWQDRISQTYLTPAVKAASEELVASPQES